MAASVPRRLRKLLIIESIMWRMDAPAMLAAWRCRLVDRHELHRSG